MHRALLDRCSDFEVSLEAEIVCGRGLATPAPPAPRSGLGRGFACVQATIGVEGRVQDPVVVLTDHREFAASFLAVLGDWRFEPCTRGGAAVPARKMLSASFTRP